MKVVVETRKRIYITPAKDRLVFKVETTLYVTVKYVLNTGTIEMFESISEWYWVYPADSVEAIVSRATEFFEKKESEVKEIAVKYAEIIKKLKVLESEKTEEFEL